MMMIIKMTMTDTYKMIVMVKKLPITTTTLKTEVLREWAQLRENTPLVMGDHTYR